MERAFWDASIFEIVWFIVKIIIAIGIIAGIIFVLIWVYSFFWVSSFEKNWNNSTIETIYDMSIKSEKEINDKKWEEFIMIVSHKTGYQFEWLKSKLELLSCENGKFLVELGNEVSEELTEDIRSQFSAFFTKDAKLKFIKF